MGSSPSLTITGNMLTVEVQKGYALDMYGATPAIVESNRVSGPPSITGILVEDFGAGGNTISKNTVIGGFCGLSTYKTNQGDNTSGTRSSTQGRRCA